MKIYEEVSEEMKIGNNTYMVKGCHRDWNPMPIHKDQVPEGTVWELVAYLDGIQKVVGSGSSKEEAIHNLIFAMGFRSGVEAAKLGPNRPT